MIFVIAIVGLLLCYMAWQYYELQQFRVTTYEITTDKLKEDMRLMVLSDLHCHQYGNKNERLLRAIKQEAPDLILIPGDLIMDKVPEKYGFSEEFIALIKDICPIYFSRGNHESRVIHYPETDNYKRYAAVEQKMRDFGCHILSNEKELVQIGQNQLMVYGLELDLPFYTKGIRIAMSDSTMMDYLGEADANYYNVLLAHNPAFTENYGAWGADLTVSGHNHGGLVCIPGLGSIISPQFQFFPKYSAGCYDVKGKKAVVSRGWCGGRPLGG